MRARHRRPGRAPWKVRGFLTTGKFFGVDVEENNRGLLRAALVLALVVFGLVVGYRFLAGIATAVLVLMAGLLLAVALSGPVEALHRLKVPRPVGAVGIFVGAVAFLVLGGYLFLPGLAEQASQVFLSLPGVLSDLGGRLERLAGDAGLSVGDGGAPSLSTVIGWGRGFAGGGLDLFGSLTAVVLGSVVVSFIALYLAADPGSVVGWTMRALPAENRRRARHVLAEIRFGLIDYLKGRILSMAIIGALSTAALYVIGLPGALLLGLLAGLLEFIPYFGPTLSVVPPLLLALSGDPADALWVLLAYGIIQQVESYLVTPIVMSETTSLHPAVVIASVTVLGAAFGLLGSLLAVPLTVVAKVLVEELWFRRMEEKDPEKDPAAVGAAGS